MRPLLAAAALAALGACVAVDPVTGELVQTGPRAAQGGPSAETRVTGVTVTAERVTFRMTDGARCVGGRPEGEPSGWTGVTTGCGYELPYTVTFVAGGSPQRGIVEAVPVGTGPDGRLGPRAEVYVTDVDGQRRLLVTPLGDGVRFEGTPAG
jgi:hypothetical protein